MPALPPSTLEGWYALHQVFAIDYPYLRSIDRGGQEIARVATALVEESPGDGQEGWSAGFRLVGGGADLMLVHFRPTLEELAAVQGRIRRSPLGDVLDLQYDYLSVTEAGLYHATAQAAREHEPHSEAFHAALKKQAEAELASPHIRSRLYPAPPADMRFVSFYPMTKRRSGADNWYLFARDPLEFKRIVTEMRYDEASSRYGEFGSFYTGVRLSPADWTELFSSE
jgi:peroxiredoxin